MRDDNGVVVVRMDSVFRFAISRIDAENKKLALPARAVEQRDPHARARHRLAVRVRRADTAAACSQRMVFLLPAPLVKEAVACLCQTEHRFSVAAPLRRIRRRAPLDRFVVGTRWSRRRQGSPTRRLRQSSPPAPRDDRMRDPICSHFLKKDFGLI